MVAVLGICRGRREDYTRTAHNEGLLLYAHGMANASIARVPWALPTCLTAASNCEAELYISGMKCRTMRLH
jgi:hypothetical protein